ncbi:MAG: SagB/ThcOx family dehydrogenase [Gammaproteobacteria bacterium]|nr:SagB/ThcOx family dehydrogenase [Gammaproteobacteria bacterium]
MTQVANNIIALPAPQTSGGKPLQQLLQHRRSVREFQQAKLPIKQIAQLLWAAQGITHPQGLRTAPSAGALYPLELYVVAINTESLDPGIYHYQPRQHQLTPHREGEYGKALARAAYGQTWLQQAGAVFVIAARYEKTTVKYGKRGERYVHIEAGHAAENLFLQAEALNLGTVVVGAFYDDEVTNVLQLPADVSPLLLMPVGFK